MGLLIQDLGKTYQDGNVALSGFNLEIETGVFGLLGPNGAGKSTLLEILSLNLMPTVGKIFWAGKDIQKSPRRYRRLMGYLPQNYGYYGELTVERFLRYMGSLHGLGFRQLRRRVAECLELVNLTDVSRRKTKSLSGGMKQRLALAQTLIASPSLLIVDEPTTGLDPGERVAFRNMLFDLGQRCLVILSTHIVKDVEYSCHEMSLLYGGSQSFTGSPVDFIAGVEGRVFEVKLPLEHYELFASSHHVVAIQESEDRVNVRFISRERGTAIEGAQLVKSNLEDAYVDFVRRQERKTIVGPSN